MSKHKPTYEQRAVIDAFTAGKNLVVEAGAGCGKSTTLKMAALTRPNAKGIYVAYNKALADEAARSFPPSVQCKTAHSLAYGPVGKRYAHRLNGPRLPAREVARILRINEPVRISESVPLVAPQQLARCVMEAVKLFCNSSDTQVQPWHVRPINGLSDADMLVWRNVVVPIARRAWEDLTDLNGRLKYEHDCYLKQFQLSKPELSCDYVLLDEAQDASPVMAAIFEQQAHAQRIMVGDASQAIYQWRGATDAMSKFDAEQRLTLAQSFRFGPAVADEANKWLSILDAPIRLRGFDPIATTLAPLEHPDAVLCRTNSEAVAQVMRADQTGRRAALVGGGAAIRRLAGAAITLKAGQGTDHPELFMFRTWGEVQEYVEHDSAGSDLRVFVRLIDSHGPEVVIEAVDQLVDERYADVIVSTAHKAKGREFPTVRIADDFREPKASEDNPNPRIQREDAMLAYVAVTRAQQVLDRSGLAWVDHWYSAAPQETPAAEEPTPSPVEVHPSTPDLVVVKDGHCFRCGSSTCYCGPDEAARWSALTGQPAGRNARKAAA